MEQQQDLFGNGDDRPVEQVEWWCPACDETHCVAIGRRWSYNNNATFPTIHPNVRTTTVNKVCNCKVRNGQIEFLDDCTHTMAGLTVTLQGLREWRTPPKK